MLLCWHVIDHNMPRRGVAKCFLDGCLWNLCAELPNFVG